VFDSIPAPSVLTVLRDKERNFVLKIYAYRQLSESEAKQALSVWLSSQKLKRVPQNKTVITYSILGYNCE
jgi:hypothetical protein